MNDEYEIVFSVGVTIDIDRRQKDGGDDQSGTGNRSCLQSQVHSMQTALGNIEAIPTRKQEDRGVACSTGTMRAQSQGVI